MRDLRNAIFVLFAISVIAAGIAYLRGPTPAWGNRGTWDDALPAPATAGNTT